MSDGQAPRAGLLPVADERTELLILGSFPSVASLALGQYYGNPRNQFWRLVESCLHVPMTGLPYSARLERLLEHGIGLWDVVARCVRSGSLDRSIRQAEVNDFQGLGRSSPGLRICVLNGAAAARLAKGRLPEGLDSRPVPSSSAAHASQSFQVKEALWRRALDRGSDGSL